MTVILKQAKFFEELCGEPKGISNSKTLYWSAEVYGMGHEIRHIGFFPERWPLNIYCAHGISLANKPAPHELDTMAPVMLYNSIRLVKIYKDLSSKPCFCIVSPFVSYRRRNKVTPSPEASGTIVFVAHTTPDLDDHSDIDQLIAQLKELPEKFKPITICLHYHDINKGLHHRFMDENFRVETVGHPYHKDFIKRYYELLRTHKFASSNLVGSYLFYAVEMGIPFFLYGNEPNFYNKGDNNIEKGVYDSYKKNIQHARAEELFGNFADNVTEEQRFFVEEQIGVNDSVSRTKLAYILYSVYWKYKKNQLWLKLKIALKRKLSSYNIKTSKE